MSATSDTTTTVGIRTDAGAMITASTGRLAAEREARGRHRGRLHGTGAPGLRRCPARRAGVRRADRRGAAAPRPGEPARVRARAACRSRPARRARVRVRTCCSRFSRSMSARSVSRCELTELYSPVAIDIAPATRPAHPGDDDRDAARRTRRPRRSAVLAVDTMPSPAPSTAARSQPIAPVAVALGVRGRLRRATGYAAQSHSFFLKNRYIGSADHHHDPDDDQKSVAPVQARRVPEVHPEHARDQASRR